MTWFYSAAHTSTLDFVANARSGGAIVTAKGKSSCSSTISGYMQDFNPSTLCSGVTSGSLTDRRDNQIYTVSKLNGGWWMTRNLAIGCNGSGSNYGSSYAARVLTATDTHLLSQITTPNTAPSKTYDTTTLRGVCDSSYGMYYSYALATAGTITGDDNIDTAVYDICPAGWKLPSKTELEEVASYTTPFRGAYWTFIEGKIYGNINGYGLLWSTTPYGSSYPNNRYALNSSTTPIVQGNGSRRDDGLFVRCVLSV